MAKIVKITLFLFLVIITFSPYAFFQTPKAEAATRWDNFDADYTSEVHAICYDNTDNESDCKYVVGLGGWDSTGGDTGWQYQVYRVDVTLMVDSFCCGSTLQGGLSTRLSRGPGSYAHPLNTPDGDTHFDTTHFWNMSNYEYGTWTQSIDMGAYADEINYANIFIWLRDLNYDVTIKVYGRRVHVNYFNTVDDPGSSWRNDKLLCYETKYGDHLDDIWRDTGPTVIKVGGPASECAYGFTITKSENIWMQVVGPGQLGDAGEPSPAEVRISHGVTLDMEGSFTNTQVRSGSFWVDGTTTCSGDAVRLYYSVDGPVRYKIKQNGTDVHAVADAYNNRTGYWESGGLGAGSYDYRLYGYNEDWGDERQLAQVTMTASNCSSPSVDIWADSTSITYDTATTIRWTSTGADSCSITKAGAAWSSILNNPGGWGSGNLTSTTVFAITCTNAYGSTSDSVTVNVADPVPWVDIWTDAGATTIEYNTATTVRWNSGYLTSCTVTKDGAGFSSGLSGAVGSGNLTANTTFAISCTGSYGARSDSAIVNVAVPPATATITVSNANPYYNTSVNVIWSSNNVSSCSVTSSPAGFSSTALNSAGTPSALLTVDTTFSITCIGLYGFNPSSSVFVDVWPAPTSSISASPTTVIYGNNTTLSWSAANLGPGGLCAIYADPEGPAPAYTLIASAALPSGSQLVQILQNMTFAIDCVGPNVNGGVLPIKNVSVFLNCTDNATAAFITPIPANVLAGTTVTFTVRVTNTGGGTNWYSADAYKYMKTGGGITLVSTAPVPALDYGRLSVPVNLGSSVDFTFNFVVPAVGGPITLSMQMMHAAGFDYQTSGGTCAAAPGSNVYFGSTLSTTFTVIAIPTCSSVYVVGYAPNANPSITDPSIYVEVSGVTSATAVTFPTWSNVNGQNDLRWYPGTNQGGGVWRGYIQINDYHLTPGNPEYGQFSVHVYMTDAIAGTHTCDTAGLGQARFQRPSPPTYCRQTVPLSSPYITLSDYSTAGLTDTDYRLGDPLAAGTTAASLNRANGDIRVHKISNRTYEVGYSRGIAVQTADPLGRIIRANFTFASNLNSARNTAGIDYPGVIQYWADTAGGAKSVDFGSNGVPWMGYVVYARATHTMPNATPDEYGDAMDITFEILRPCNPSVTITGPALINFGENAILNWTAQDITEGSLTITASAGAAITQPVTTEADSDNIYFGNGSVSTLGSGSVTHASQPATTTYTITATRPDTGAVLTNTFTVSVNTEGTLRVINRDEALAPILANWRVNATSYGPATSQDITLTYGAYTVTPLGPSVDKCNYDYPPAAPITITAGQVTPVTFDYRQGILTISTNLPNGSYSFSYTHPDDVSCGVQTRTGPLSGDGLTPNSYELPPATYTVTFNPIAGYRLDPMSAVVNNNATTPLLGQYALGSVTSPTNFTANPGVCEQVTVTWTDISQMESGYELYRRDDTTMTPEVLISTNSVINFGAYPAWGYQVPFPGYDLTRAPWTTGTAYSFVDSGLAYNHNYTYILRTYRWYPNGGGPAPFALGYNFEQTSVSNILVPECRPNINLTLRPLNVYRKSSVPEYSVPTPYTSMVSIYDTDIITLQATIENINVPGVSQPATITQVIDTLTDNLKPVCTAVTCPRGTLANPYNFFIDTNGDNNNEFLSYVAGVPPSVRFPSLLTSYDVEPEINGSGSWVTINPGGTNTRITFDVLVDSPLMDALTQMRIDKSIDYRWVVGADTRVDSESVILEILYNTDRPRIPRFREVNP